MSLADVEPAENLLCSSADRLFIAPNLTSHSLNVKYREIYGSSRGNNEKGGR